MIIAPVMRVELVESEFLGETERGEGGFVIPGVTDMGHTQEPWSTFDAGSAIHIDQASGPGFVGSITVFPHRDDECRENARRIVAAVNACAGISTELLEHGLGLGAILNSEAIEYAEIEKQRDELLAALELIYSWARNWDSEFMNDPEWKDIDEPRIKALVAQVKGSAP
jgi:hypothetical protein